MRLRVVVLAGVLPELLAHRGGLLEGQGAHAAGRGAHPRGAGGGDGQGAREARGFFEHSGYRVMDQPF
jgi:hypothetical protein